MGKKEDQKIADELVDELDSVGGDLEEKSTTAGEESDYDDESPGLGEDDSKEKESEDEEDEEEEDDESDDSKDSDDEDDDEEESDEKDSDDDSEDDDSDEEDDDEDEEEEDDSTKGDRVPVSKVAQIREKYRGKIKGYKARIKELEGGKATEESDSKEIDTKVKGLVEKYEMDEPAVKEMLEIAAEIAEKRIRKNLKIEDGEVLSEAAKMVMQQKEVAHFEKEWTGAQPAVAEAYPNASPGQLAEAKTLMDRISHTKEFRKFPLDYVLFKNRKAFDKIMRKPKQKTIERGSTGSRASDTNDTTDVPYEKMSQKQQERFERRLFGASDEGGTFVTRGGKRVRVDD